MARGEDPKLVALRAVPLFDGMSKKDLAAVGRIADEIDLPAGKELIREGRRGTQFFILLEGEADVRRRGRKVSTLREGDFFGEIALLQDVPRTATVRADTDARLYALERDDFLAVVTGNSLVRTHADAVAGERVESNAAAAERAADR